MKLAEPYVNDPICPETRPDEAPAVLTWGQSQDAAQVDPACQIEVLGVDDPALVPLARLGAEFCRVGRIPGIYKPAVWLQSWRDFMRLGIGKVLVLRQDGAVIGGLGLLMFKDPNNGDLVASEAFWWVAPEARGRGMLLLKRAIRVAKEAGAKRLSMIHLTALNARLGQIYERLGFQPIETAYWKEI